MYVCMYVCMYVGMYACMYVCMYACMHACLYVYEIVYVYVSVYVYIFIHRYVYNVYVSALPNKQLYIQQQSTYAKTRSTSMLPSLSNLQMRTSRPHICRSHHVAHITVSMYDAW